MSVSTVPGQIAFFRILYGPRANVHVAIFKPVFVTTYTRIGHTFQPHASLLPILTAVNIHVCLIVTGDQLSLPTENDYMCSVQYDFNYLAHIER